MRNAQAYISAVTDPKTISVVGPSGTLSAIKAFTASQGLLCQAMHISGKVHNPENEDLAAELCGFCDQNESFRYPKLDCLQAPLRSNRNGELCNPELLTQEVVRTILASRCNWYELLSNVSNDLKCSGRQSHTLINFGVGDCLSPIPFHRSGLKITKLNAMSFIEQNRHFLALQPSQSYSYPPDAIAVIGMACRLPGANDVNELWDLISSGRSTVEELSHRRPELLKSFRISQDPKATGKQKFYGNFMDRLDSFDNGFFGLSPREATSMDPQQRLLLETAYQAIESSGYAASHQRSSGDRVGVFIGGSIVEYLANTMSHAPTAYTSTGTLGAFTCGRISFQFGWTGPAELVDTACSSSLVAIHRACKAIQGGECSMALAGGVSAICSIHNFLDLGKAGFLSPTGQCKPFDEAADGYCRAEGVGLVVLKSLNQALEAGDSILGVIPATATNQGGLSSSITVPHSPTQVQLYQKILEDSGLAFNQISYVEAHGTGTQAGDPLEAASIRKVFGGSNRATPLHLGSIKGNIGHCETAAGVAGFIKALLILQKHKLPPLASHNSLNPRILNLDESGMAVATHTIPWDAQFKAVCVNSYGAAGSNAAMLVCQGPQRQSMTRASKLTDNGFYPFILSAYSVDSLIAYAIDLSRYLEEPGFQCTPADVAFTLAEKRKHHRVRWTTTGSDLVKLNHSLQTGVYDYSEPPTQPKKIVLAFSGQVGQTIGLENALYESCALLRSFLDQCNNILVELGYSSLYPAMFQSEPISNVGILQCGLFALQYSTAMTWIASGLHVETVIGHSLGEFAALAVAEILSLKDALKLVAYRSSLMETKWGPHRGVMLVVRAPFAVAMDLISSTPADSWELQIACYNANTSHVLVGTERSIAETERVIRENCRFSGLLPQRLSVTHGFHSVFTEGILKELNQAASLMPFREPRITFEACTLEHQEITSERIAKHAREPVYFHHAINRIQDRLGPCSWIEAGINSPIIPMIRQALISSQDHSFHSMKIKNEEHPLSSVCRVTTDLWREGISVSFWNFHEPQERGLQQVWLPPYHFEQNRHWLPYVDRTIEALESRPQPDSPSMRREEQAQENNYLKLIIRKSGTEGSKNTSTFTINTKSRRFLDAVTGHAVLRRPLCPASLYMECAIAAAQSSHGSLDQQTIWFENCFFESPLSTAANYDVLMTLDHCNESTSWAFVVQSSTGHDKKSKKLMHAKGKFGFSRKQSNISHYQRIVSNRVAELIKNPNLEYIKRDKAYKLFSRVVEYSAIFHGISFIRLAGNEALAGIDILPQSLTADSLIASKFDAIPMDVFLQVCGFLINCHERCPMDELFLAISVENLSTALSCDFQQCLSWTVYTMFTPLSDFKVVGDVFVMKRDGTLTLSMMGVQFSKIPKATLHRLLDSSSKVTTKPSPDSSLHDLEKPQIMSSDVSSSDVSVESTASPTSAKSSQTSSDNGSEDSGRGAGESELRKILASTAGLPENQITVNTSFSELGIDSLAAIELADQLSSKFKQEVSSSSLADCSFKSLCGILGIREACATTTVRIEKETSQAVPSTHVNNLESKPVPGSERKPVSNERQKLAEMISGHSGCPVSSIEDNSSLRDLGIDSLSKIELKADIESAFEIDIDDAKLSTDSTVAEMLLSLGSNALLDTKTQIAPDCRSESLKSDFAPSVALGDNHQTTCITADPTEILADCGRSFEKSARNHGFLDYWKNVAPAQDELMVAYVAEALKSLGVDLWLIKDGQNVPEFGHSRQHNQVVKRLWSNLENLSIIVSRGDKIVRTGKSISQTPSTVVFEQFIESYPDYASEARLMNVTGSKLASCLKGDIDPLSLLFGRKESSRILGDFYHHSCMLGTMTDQLVQFTGRLMMDNCRGIVRILEIGAGFGGTTTMLAEKLHACGRSIEYIFTDISPTLVDKARTTFSKYPWMNFQVINIERQPPVSLQGQFDIVIATNVVHATANLVNSCQNIKLLLKDGGFTCLSEITQTIHWHDIVFGLLPGWWCFNDGRSYPLQAAEQWMEVFEKAGFLSMSFSSGPSLESRSQQLLIGSTRPPRKVSSIKSSPANPRLRQICSIETVVYKEVDGTEIHADIFFPIIPPSSKVMPIGQSHLDRKIA